ncbi:non-structural maintenance of chromosomes element 4 homolog A isoform X3 [Anguilla anguilla]|uniref:non-structural maintenance of chromosomes element 4 homolog A isoform X3 n=2 Tax=Anguilla anguilla TaxID=7936 RepID=UPI0015AF353F|nr:non-structural maintenance of chromosomes element 4 homolog A isoform X3 [Anguilla anguilla]
MQHVRCKTLLSACPLKINLINHLVAYKMTGSSISDVCVMCCTPGVDGIIYNVEAIPELQNKCLDSLQIHIQSLTQRGTGVSEIGELAQEMAEANRRAGRGGQGTPAPQQNGTGRRSRSQRDEDTSDEDEVGSHQRRSSQVPEEDDDPAQRRLIRHRYRELINSVQQNREDILCPSSDKLTEVLKQADQLFNNVRQAREAALDAQFLVLATDLGKEKACQLQADGSTFDPSVYAEHLLTFMGLNRLEEEDSDEEGGYLPQDAWQRLGAKAQDCFRTAPSFRFMLGSFMAEPPPPRQRVERQRKAPNKEVKRIMPTQVKKVDESHQEATEKEVERILGYLQQYHQEDPNSPISYFEFVIDPRSFSRTVENIFHVSFLIRDGLARMYLDTDKLPYIAPVEQGEAEAGGSSSRQQCVISLSQANWKEIIQAFDIKEAMIGAPVPCTPVE